VAFLVPVYSGESGSPGGTVATTHTLVGVNGLWVVWLLCIPVFLVLTAWTGLHFRCSRSSGWGTRVAWSSVVLLWAFALIGSASVGFFLLPTALLLVVAATQTPTATAPLPAS
jgi:multisubunit Na+/H+ antiporter MnhG subunit